VSERTRSLDKAIGARVRARRLEIGVTQEELARRLGVSFQQVQKYEQGINRISAASLVLTAEALDCRPHDLLGTDDQGDPLDWSRFHDRDAVRLVEAFSAIRSAGLKRAVMDFITALSE
jgi:transcriptional regulator with XRE-family HTH domain